MSSGNRALLIPLSSSIEIETFALHFEITADFPLPRLSDDLIILADDYSVLIFIWILGVPIL